MNYKDYSKDSTYKVLSILCKLMNIGIIYEGDTANSNEMDAEGRTIIIMPEDDDEYIRNGKNITFVLGHEIAHILIEREFNDKNGRACILTEHCCDQIGIGLYFLADSIVDEIESYKEEFEVSLYKKLTEILGGGL